MGDLQIYNINPLSNHSHMDHKVLTGILNFTVKIYNEIWQCWDFVLLLLPNWLELTLPIQESHVCCCFNTIIMTYIPSSLLKRAVLPVYFCMYSSWNTYCQAKGLISALCLSHSTLKDQNTDDKFTLDEIRGAICSGISTVVVVV